ncbi:MAG TPA: Crp/Fnr family transcriptional regulator [Solirubrobacteraceae bacterium]|nr:Crp/Fnr family transcriptional regulator [Solirubrobacteraceae bacterium]
MAETERYKEGPHRTDVERGSNDRWHASDPRWRAGRNGSAPNRSGALRYLLDLDTDLAEGLDIRLRLAARPAATAIVFDAGAGEIELSTALARSTDGPGLLLLEGVIATSVRVGDRVAAELLGAGDLLEPDEVETDELVACMTEWRALQPARFAVLDGAFAERIRPWPQLTQALLRRVERRAHNLNVQRAIASQPRLEIRLTLLLWHLASRWGRVEPGGIRLPLPLTHQLLGRLIGAERPSVSHALARLSRTGAVTGHGDEWHLHGSIEDLLGMLGHSGEGVAPLVARVNGRA